MSARSYRSFHVGFSVLALLFVAACEGTFTFTIRLPKRADASETHSVAMPAGAGLVVTNDVGSTRVSIDPTATAARIEIRRLALADSQEAADELLGKIVVTVTPPSDSDNHLRISAPKPAEATGTDSDLQLTVSEEGDEITIVSLTNTTLVAQVELRITLPPGHGANVTQDVGSIRATSLDTESTLTTRRGSIRSLSARTRVTAASQLGGITIESHRGSTSVTTETGHVELRIRDLDVTDSVIARVRNGQIELRLPADVRADLSAVAESNSISFRRFDFFKVEDLDRTAHTLTAILNDGGALVDVLSETGHIDIDSN